MSLRRSRRAVFVILGLVIVSLGCGGGSPTKSRTSEDGRILLRNTTSYTLSVKYKSEELGLITTDIEPGDTQIVSGEELVKGGKRVVLTVVTIISGGGMPLTQDIEVTIDGNITILASPTGRRGVELTAAA